MKFEPIAIVGRGALFPAALNPAALWDLVHNGRDAVSRVPDDRWRLPKSCPCPDSIGTARGGYVEGFQRIFDPSGFAIPPDDLATYDRTVHWILHTAREALREAGVDVSRGAPERTGAVVGLLGLPSESMARFAEQVWSGERPAVAPANRFASGLPSHLLARALQLDLGAFSLDAACASSLYAIKLACDALHDGRADLMLAGAASAADDLFLHVGFSALKALSRTGASRPFHRAADGLLPAEGAGFVALRRLEDAEACGNRILGVIRGIGISNDGRTAGLLTPSAVGQEQAMRDAYRIAGVDPSTISLIECHATGTPVGDVCEIQSMSRVFEHCRDIPIGSIKANFGHPMTAAGMAGLLKLLGAIEHRVLPPLLHVAGPADEIEAIAGSPFRVPAGREPWDSRGPRRAALNAFGFGGNNAHLIVEEHLGIAVRHADSRPAPGPQIAIVSMGVCAGDAADADAFARALFLAEPRARRTEAASLDAEHLGFPPVDLEAALPQQVLALQAASDALQGSDTTAKTGVYVGLGCDIEAARTGLRWRSSALAAGRVESTDSICPPLTAPAVVGRLANIVANRISSKFDFRGPSFAVMSEERSGIVALRLAARALGRGEVDRAVVGAVDLSCEPVHEHAARAALSAEQQVSGDAAVFFVLTRLEDAPGEVLAILGDGEQEAWSVPGASVSGIFGHAHAASGLMQTAAGVLACAHGALPAARPWLTASPRRARIEVQALGGASAVVTVAAAPGSRRKPLLLSAAPQITVYSGTDRREVLEALRLGRPSADGPARLALVATGAADFESRCELARQGLEAGRSPWLDGVYFQPGPIGGELALVFPGAAAAYPGMGKSLLLAFPELVDYAADRCPGLLASAQWVFDPECVGEPDAPAKLWGSSLVSQAHARFTMSVLGVSPSAAIGVSSGETNSLAAFGVWRDVDRFHGEFTAARVLDRALGGAFEVTGGARWEAWQITVPEGALPRLLAENPGVRLTGVFAPGEYTIAGDPQQCARAAHGIGRGTRIHYDLAIHCREFTPYAEAWRRLHDRECFATPGVRFYTHATGTCYRPDRFAVADALTRQAMSPLDFPRLIERAWEDGVRVFLEQGPQGGCASRIRRILGEREHLAVATDLAGVDSLRQAANAVAQLIAAGVAAPNAAVFERLRNRSYSPARKTFRLPMHAPPVVVPSKHAEAPPPASRFGQHARSLATAYAEFLEASAAAYGNFLATSRRAYLEAARGSPAPTQIRRFTRQDLERLASGPVSDVLGPEFRPLDQFRRVVRLPRPPLLLVDRVVALEGRPLGMGTGAITTETDVRPDSWHLYRGRMPAGLWIEAGQADLLLISWLGIDLHAKGERVYRLLGCDILFHGGLPRSGDTLRFEIHIDRHARQGEIRLFFFRCDCWIGERLCLSVRNGQAGFFTEQELAQSAGVLWSSDTSDDGPRPEGRYDLDQLRAASVGKAYECFGAGFEAAAAHQRSPGFAAPDLLLLHTVTHFRPHRAADASGYLRAEFPIQEDSWFFDGHFQDDPCMPGNLMFEGCLQAMGFYMMASGMTLQRDGWRFEPVAGATYPLQCRGQVTPSSRLLVYEVFVRQLAEQPEPAVFADVLCTVDGLKAFLCRGMGLRLTPGHPLDDRREVVRADQPVASVNGVALDRRAMLAAACGSPIEAFGAPFARFENGDPFPRLPAPPYLFMSRITELEGEFGAERAACRITAECDVDPSDWHFQANESSEMPLAVLLEMGLQPCGWLSNFTGVPLRAAGRLHFRNLDGTAEIAGAVCASRGTMRTEATLIRIARSAGITLLTFDARCEWDGRTVMRMQTSFGFFSKDDLARQAGLPAPSRIEGSSVNIDLSARPARYFTGPLALPSGKLLMLSRITGFEPAGERPGWMRAEIDLHPSDWFFQAHFYQDPVQPGSLGIEALMQVLRLYAIHCGLAEGVADAVLIPDGGLSWKYRGQVLPANRLVTVEVTVKRVERSVKALTIRAEGQLSVDGLAIYHCADFGARIVHRSS